MKQKILAAAIASTLAVPFAAQAGSHGDNTWYGRINTGLKITDADGADTTADVKGFGSRFGVKGSSDLGNGLSIGYKFEFAVDSDIANVANNNRISEIALSGSFGTFKIGKFWGAAFSHVGTIMDPNNGSGGLAYANTLGGYRVGNSIGYSTAAGNLSFMVDAQIDGANAASDGIDSWNAGVTYNSGSLSVGLAHNDDQAGSDATGVAAAFSMENMRVSGGYASKSTDGAGDVSGVMLRLDGKAGEGNISWGIQLNDLDDDDNGSSDSVALNLYNELGKGTMIWSELEMASSDAGGDTNSLILGVRKNF